VPALDEALRGSGWFDAATYPDAVFRSTVIAITGPAAEMAAGDLTLLGMTHPVTLAVTFNGGADNLLTGRYTLRFSANATPRPA
jgi:polyisoprenoid-binding protein YceI